MLTLFSVVTSVKDYIEIVHKLVETNQNLDLNSYYDFGAIFTYLIICFKNLCKDILSLNWLVSIWSLPIIVPNIASSIISEVSVLDGYFHNLFTFLENPISYGNNNLFFYALEKFTIGLVNSIFLCLPTSTAHIITIRRFVVQGLEAGYISGLGTIAGNIVWLSSIIFGFRFIIIPWLSLDLLRYILGFSLLVKYMWDSYNEKRNVTEDLSKRKIFLLTFLLSFTEQTSLFPFVTNLSMSADSTMLETFSTNNLSEFFIVHFCYLSGILIGSFSLLNFTCWFWENPAFKLYIWAVSSFKISTSTYYNYLNFFFLYATMVCTICSIPYFGLDYTMTNPFGLIQEDRILEEKNLLETSFLTSKGSDKNTRQTKRGRRGRNEKWKRRVERYRAFDASLYDQGVYDLFTIEDLNYGFDRFWLRRKMKRSNKGFRLFPGEWMRSFKKQMSKSQLESLNAPRLDFFRLLFEQAYSPTFHERKLIQNTTNITPINGSAVSLKTINNKMENTTLSLYLNNISPQNKQNFIDENSTLRKFMRKTTQRLTTAKITKNLLNSEANGLLNSDNINKIYSKRWKIIFSKLSKRGISNQTLFNSMSKEILIKQKSVKNNYNSLSFEQGFINNTSNLKSNSSLSLISKLNSETNLSNKDRQILNYRSFLLENSNNNQYKAITLLHPLKFYLQKNKAFQRKLKFYGTKIYRNFQTEKNAPYFRVMMKRLFYYYKPNLRWEQTMTRARSRIIRKKHSRMARKLNINKNNKAFLNVYNRESLSSLEKVKNQTLENSSNFSELGVPTMNLRLTNLSTPGSFSLETQIEKPTHFYSIISKRATRYRHQIYKDVLQHWYYSPFNRLLLKLDIDSFIRRQPFSHFLTKKEENLLHLRRFLLSEHYETLRWYTFMEHYENMKNNIGGTKSFASKMYNQQFQGTFKKIRHLFALTPSLNQNENLKTNVSNKSLESNLNEKNANFGFKILKFDQVLYNEFPKTTNTNFQENFNQNNSFIHEELLKTNNLNSSPKDLLNQSSQILREYIITSIPIRERLIKKFLQEKNYAELTQFLWKGQKIRGVQTLTNEKSFLMQENNLLASKKEIEELKQQNSQKVKNLFKRDSIQKSLWLGLLKESKNLLYNREALKTYLTKKVNKYKKRKQFKEKNLKNRIERIEKWLFNTKDQNIRSIEPNSINVTTAVRKAIKESVNQSIAISNLYESTQNGLPTKLLLKRDKVYNYLTHKLKEKKLLSIYSLQKFKKYVKEIDKSVNINTNNMVSSPKRSTTALTNIWYKINKITSFTLSPFTKTFKVLYKNTKSFILNEKTNKNLTYWKAKTRFNERKNQDRKKLSTVMPKLDLQNLQEKKPRINNTILKLNMNKNDLNFYKNSTNPEFNIQNKETENYKDLIDAFDSTAAEALGRKKTDNDWTKLQEKKLIQSWKKIVQNNDLNLNEKNKFFILKNIFDKKFITKTKRRTTFVRMVRSPSEIVHKKLQLKRQLTRSINNNKNLTDLNTKLFEIQNADSNLNDSFKPDLEQVKQRKRSSFWQKNKSIKGKISSRKMRHSSLGKLKMIAKKYKRIENYNQIRNWWWQNFLPNFKSKTDILLDLETNIKIKSTLSNLSSKEILQRDSINYENYIDRVPGEKQLQIGNKDYKPLNIPQAIRLRQQLLEQNVLNFNSQNTIKNSSIINENASSMVNSSNDQDVLRTTNNQNSATLISEKNLTGLDKLYENILIPQNNFFNGSVLNNSKFMLGVNPVPFYAGWDESLRKFVVTNRLLSKTKAGYEMNFTNSNLKNYPTLQNLKVNKVNFERAPLQGMNLATILYWKVPFSPYDQDQFFNVGIDGFAPIGWRRFNFRHSTKTIKPLLVTTKVITTQNFANKDKTNQLVYQIKAKLFNNSLTTSFGNSKSNNLKKKIKRRVMQRIQNYDRSRDTIRFPSGALMNQILPLHYLNVFYKRYRLPSDRYIKRRFRRDQKNVAFSLKNINPTLADLTLRRRIKPRRRYHRKTLNTQKLELLPRRRAFRIEQINNLSSVAQSSYGSQTNDQLIESDNKVMSLSRPFGKEKNISTTLENKMSPKIKKRLKNKSKQDSTNLRIRRLRKRVKQQIIRINPRYKPNTGGFIWPGDYLQLELKKAPKLQIKNNDVDNVKNRRKQSKRLLKELPLPLQPKKYLLEKHNLKVLKRRLEKSQNLNQLHQKINELEFLSNN
jgi:hypothetical protein